ETLLLICRDTGREIFRANQLAQGKVALNAGARRADANGAFCLAQYIRCTLQRLLCIQFDPVVAAPLFWLTRPIFTVNVTVTKTTAVTKEVVVYRAIVAIFDTAQLTITLTRAGVAANAALL